MTPLCDAIEELMSKFAREGLTRGIVLHVSSSIMDRLYWEIQKHAGTYIRNHDDGGKEVRRTESLTLNTIGGKVLIIRDKL